MKQIKIHFEQDSLLPHIEVLIRSSEQDEQVMGLIRKISDENPDSLVITDIHNISNTIMMDDILLLSVSGKYVMLETESETYTVRQSLQNLENILDMKRFIRISRHEIVNLSKVKHFDFTLSGTLRLQLVSGTETWASRRCIPLIRKRIAGKE